MSLFGFGSLATTHALSDSNSMARVKLPSRQAAETGPPTFVGLSPRKAADGAGGSL